MTIQWVLIASFLYFELGLTVLLVLPFISPRIWKGLFRFHFWNAIERRANMYFTVFLMVLILFFLDSIREMVKYSGKHPHDAAAEIQLHMKLFRSQRNYYIVGFSIFLSMVIRRLIMLIVSEADFLDRNEEAMKKAQTATETLEKLTREEELHSDKSHMNIVPNEIFVEEIEMLKKEISLKHEELDTSKQMCASILDQQEELSKECETLQMKISQMKECISTSNDDNVD